MAGCCGRDWESLEWRKRASFMGSDASTGRYAADSETLRTVRVSYRGAAFVRLAVCCLPPARYPSQSHRYLDAMSLLFAYDLRAIEGLADDTIFCRSSLPVAHSQSFIWI